MALLKLGIPQPQWQQVNEDNLYLVYMNREIEFLLIPKETLMSEDGVYTVG